MAIQTYLYPQRNLGRTHPKYKGSRYNVNIQLKNEEITHEPLDMIANDDPVTFAVYTRENNLLDMPGWKRFKSTTKRGKKTSHMADQAKLRPYHYTPTYKLDSASI